jgi:hypothetical protein
MDNALSGHASTQVAHATHSAWSIWATYPEELPIGSPAFIAFKGRQQHEQQLQMQ